MNIDTPRTDSLVEQISDFRISSIIYSLTKFSQKLERELNAVTEQRDELLRYNEAFRKETLICADCDAIRKGEYDQAIEQRDRLAEALEQCREDSIELLGERDWWQNEPRCDYQKRYQETRDNVTRADEALQSLTPKDHE
jgi:hypothetical protein